MRWKSYLNLTVMILNMLRYAIYNAYIRKAVCLFHEPRDCLTLIHDSTINTRGFVSCFCDKMHKELQLLQQWQPSEGRGSIPGITMTQYTATCIFFSPGEQRPQRRITGPPGADRSSMATKPTHASSALGTPHIFFAV